MNDLVRVTVKYSTLDFKCFTTGFRRKDVCITNEVTNVSVPFLTWFGPSCYFNEGLAFRKDFLDSRIDKKFKTETLIELFKILLKSKIFEFPDKTFKQIWRKAISVKFAPPYAVRFMAALEGKVLNKVKKKLNVWWSCIDHIIII